MAKLSDLNEWMRDPKKRAEQIEKHIRSSNAAEGIFVDVKEKAKTPNAKPPRKSA